MTRSASVQTAHIHLETIEEGVVIPAPHQYRAILEVGSLNFGLLADGEQEAVVAGFAAFLNSLTFPLQALVRVLPLDLEPYLEEIEREAEHQTRALYLLAHDHVAYLRRLARSRTLLEHRFYLVVPAQGLTPIGGRWWWPFGRRDDGPAFDEARKQLTLRCEEVERELGRCGLASRRLGTLELAQLVYACWCPDLARVQRLQRELAAYAAPVVLAGPPSLERSV